MPGTIIRRIRQRHSAAPEAAQRKEDFMLSDPMTLYKLMVLYLLKHVSYPLTEDRLSEFFIAGNYTDYFRLKEILSQLTESAMIRKSAAATATHYAITPEGEEAFGYFGKRLPEEITEEMDRFLRENRVSIRNEVSISADYYPAADAGAGAVSGQDFTVTCEINEGRSRLLTLSFTVPDEEQAKYMCSKWKERSQEIYAYLIRQLMGN